MDLLTAHRSATRQFDNRIRRVRDAQWGNATPCADWDVRLLAAHVVAGQREAAAALTGRSASSTDGAGAGRADGGDADPVAAWTAAADAAADAWNAPGALDREVSLPTGPQPADAYLERRIVELTVHAWDLARAIGDDDDVPNDLAGVALEIGSVANPSSSRPVSSARRC